jgi:hypothetical protein
VGNPPWEVIKQGKGGQDRALATFMTSRDRPGGRFDAPLRSLTSESSSDQELPFCRQGRGDLNTYKLFLEQAAFLVRPEGRLGLVVPAGIYAEQGARDLRRMLLNKWRWEWLFAFTNRNRIFPIDNRFKFAVIVACRAGPTRRLKTAFMKQNLEEWQNAEEHSMNWPVSSSMRRAGNPFPEFTSRQEMDRFTRLTAAGMSFHQRGRNALQASYRRELDASLRQRGIRPVDELRKEGRILDRLGCSVPSSGEVNLHDIGLPVYQGVMIGQFDAAAARWVKGQGRRAVWAPLSATRGRAEAQFYMTAADYAGTTGACLDFKVAVRRITNASNVRTVIAALIPPLPCSDKVAVLSCDNHFRLLAATAMLNSFCVDWVARLLCTAANLDRHHLERLPLCPTNAPGIMDPLPLLALRLNGGHIWFAPLWRKAARQWPILLTRCWQDWWCTGPEEQRIVRSVVEALVAQAFSFDHKDLTQLLSECDHSRVQLDDRSFTARLKPRGFWRVDRHLPHHKRLPSLTLEAFHKLSIEGCEALMTDLLPSGSKDCSASVAASWDACHEWADRIDDLLSGLRSMSHQGQESLLLPCATHA